jgi:MSHA biogenesis protein MshO
MRPRIDAMRQRGFTLVEAVMVIVIVGVIGAMLAVFIRVPVQGYADSLARAELSDTADLALRRIARDLRLALPNSVRVSQSGEAIEMLLTRTGGRYLSAEDSVEVAPVLDFVAPGNVKLSVVGAAPGPDQLTPGRDYFVVNNLGPDFAPANAYDYSSAQRNITKVSDVDSAHNLIMLADNPFAVQLPPSPSPTQRFHIVSGPVTYECGLEPDGATRLLTRQSGYDIASVQLADPVRATGRGQRALLAGRVRSCQFQYEALGRRNALVILTLELQARSSTDATIRLVHQVHVDNTP